MFNRHLIYLIGFYIKRAIWYWGEHLIWLEEFMAEKILQQREINDKDMCLQCSRSHDSCWDISAKLSPKMYSSSPNFLVSLSLSVLHIMMEGALFILLLPQYVLFWRPPKHHSWGCFSRFLPPVQNWSFAEQTGTSLETSSAVAECNVGFWMQSCMVCSLNSLPKRLRGLFQTVTIIPDLFPGDTLVILFSSLFRDL